MFLTTNNSILLGMYRLLLLPSFLFLFASCSGSAVQNKMEAQLEISRLMDLQVAAWNNGDLEAFMAPYTPTDSLLFVSKSGVTSGWEKTLSNYKTNYPNKATMGELKFTNSHYNKLGDNFMQVIGRWELIREIDSVGGYYTLIWEFKNGKWFIVSDHTS
jgi:hypothetical protein